MRNAFTVLLVAAAFAGCAMTLETVAVPADPAGWKAASGINRRAATILEYVPENESISNWSRMLTIQFFQGNRMSPKQIMEGQLANLRAKCPGAQSAVVAEDSLSITYEWWVVSCAGQSPQHEIVRLLRGNDGAHRVAYVRKVPRLEVVEREEWLKVMSGAYVEKGGQRAVVAP